MDIFKVKKFKSVFLVRIQDLGTEGDCTSNNSVKKWANVFIVILLKHSCSADTCHANSLSFFK